MLYQDHYLGMNLLWWFVWGVLLFWIFVLPFDIPGQRKSKEASLFLLKRRFAMGQITTAEYTEKRKLFEKENLLK